MKTRLVTIMYATLIGVAALSSHALAQQKTVKACEEEWQANKAANQAKGILERDYVAKCRAAGTAAPAAAAPAAAAPTTPPPTAPAPAARAPAAAAPATRPAAPAAAAPTGANEFATEAQAKARCPTDTVVWVNTSSKIYHFTGTADYGKTKAGAYMCEKDTAARGFRAAKNEKHP
jgi:hypothetical protein